jgi:hypothetical protein
MGRLSNWLHRRSPLRKWREKSGSAATPKEHTLRPVGTPDGRLQAPQNSLATVESASQPASSLAPAAVENSRASKVSLGDFEPVPQSQSPFFTMLPAEIRTEIFKLVLAKQYVEEAIHIGECLDQLSHVRCPEQASATTLHNLKNRWKRNHQLGDSLLLYNDPTGKLPGLLVTCRRMYVLELIGPFGRGKETADRRSRYFEAISVLYAHNVFSFNNHCLLYKFVARVAPSSVNSIRELQVNVFRPGEFNAPPNASTDFSHWNHLFDLLKEMKGLRRLRITFTGSSATYPPGCFEAIRLIDVPLFEVGFSDRCIYADPERLGMFRDAGIVILSPKTFFSRPLDSCYSPKSMGW